MNQQTNRGIWPHFDFHRTMGDHLLSEKHSRCHKFIFGMTVSIFGVSLSHYLGHTGIDILAIAGHHLGYAIHGIGFIPMYKAIEKKGGMS